VAHRDSAPGDLRRLAAATRLRRAKRAILVTVGGVGLVVWSLVAGAIAASAGGTHGASTAATVTSPEGSRFFEGGRRSSGISQPITHPTPILRSRGS
jgi:hypothetical protein